MAKPKAEFRLTVITVEGESRFPLDMLRYDNCVPSTSYDVMAMDKPGKRRVVLRRFSYDGGKATAERWQSFGWNVVEDG